MRAIAEAGVDAALISYHFGSKRGLFGACMELSTNPADLLAQALDGPLNALPKRLVATVLRAWDDPEGGASQRALAQAAVREPDVARVFREMAESEMLPRIAERLTGPDRTSRAAVVASQMAGLIFMRYLLRLEPIASMPTDELVTLMTPALRTALAGPRPTPPSG